MIELDWKEKYWRLNGIVGWHAELQPPDEEYERAARMADRSMRCDALLELANERKKKHLGWNFYVAGLAIWREEDELFIPPAVESETPEKAVEEYWEMAICDNREQHCHAVYDDEKVVQPRIKDGLAFYRYAKSVAAFLERNAPGTDLVLNSSGEFVLHSPGEFMETNFALGSVAALPGLTIKKVLF